MSTRRREQFLPGADGSIRIAGRRVDVRSLTEELSIFPDLQNAVASNDIGRVKALLATVLDPVEQKELLNQADKDGFRLLHRACALGSVELMNVLIQVGADPNARDNCGDAPMHWACFSGNLEAVQALLEGGGDPLLASSDGKTPLDAALEEKHTHILQLLFGRPWNVYDSRAILDAVLLRGPLFIKVQSRFVTSRRVWRVQHTILSSMLRALFIYRGKEMTDSAADCEHVCFQELLAVKWQNHTQKRYVGRRFNVYARIPDVNSLKFNFTSSGLDSLRAADYAEEKGDEEVVNEDGNDSDDDQESRASHGRRGALASRFMSSFRKPKEGNADATNSGKITSPQSSPRRDGSDSAKSICIAFLAENAKEAKRWMDAFKVAGLLGKTMPCVRIQTCWRGYRARTLLKKLREYQKEGSDVVSRRGLSTNKKFIALDASHISTVPPAATALTVTKRPSIVNQLLHVSVGGKRRMTNIPGPSTAAQGASSSSGIELPRTFKARKTTALALPVENVIDTAEDMAGYLKKRSETGVSGALRLWKNRYIIISHTSAEVQYFNPKKKPLKVHHIPFSTLLSVKPVEKDKEKLCLAIRVIGGSTYRFQASTTEDRDRWITALKRVLPRENVSAVQIQRVVRGRLARKRVAQLRYLALQRAMRKRDEALIRIEEARQRAAAEIEARASKEEAALLLRLQEEEREHRRRLKALKRKVSQEARLLDRPLPPGWREFTDKKTGRIYYYNKETRETTWTRPEPVAAASDENQHEDMDEDTEDEKVEATKTVEASLAAAKAETTAEKVETRPRKNSSSSGLPPNWREVVDPKSGETYYFNVVTQKSTWTRPRAKENASPWSKRYDPISGNYYFYDERTGNSQWEVPEGFVDEEEEERTAAKVAATSTTTSTATTSSSSVREEPVEYVDSTLSFGKEDPLSETGAKKRSGSDRDMEDEVFLTDANKRATVQRAKAAMAIQRSISASSADGSHSSSTATQSLNVLHKALEKTTMKRTRPDQWQKFVDPKSGSPYYVNTATGEKTWIKPAVLGGPRSKKEAWIALKDDQGREYFNNSITGESVWTLPPGECLASDAENPETDSEIVAAFTRHVDMLLSSFPKRRATTIHSDDDDDSDDDGGNRAEPDWSLLDEEDDPQHYVALHEKGGLFEAVRSGLVLCRLVNRVAPDTIDPRAMNIDVDALGATASTEEEREHVIRLAKENLALFLGAVRALGGQLSEECTPEMLMGSFPSPSSDDQTRDNDERQKYVIEALWEVLQIDLLEPVSVTSCRPLLNLMDTSKETVHEFESLHESEKLLRWLAFHCPQLPRIEFGEANSSVYLAAALCSALWAGKDPRLPSASLPSVANRIMHDPEHETSTESQSELFVQLAQACQSVGIRLYACRATCLKLEDPKVQLACCASVFAEHHNLPVDVALTEDEQNDLKALALEQDTDESRDERILRTWINSLNIRMQPGANPPAMASSPTKKRGPTVATLRIKNLFFDLRDGVVLLHVFQAVQPNLNVFANYNKVHLRPENKFHMIENASVIIDLAKSGLGLSVVNLGPYDIVDGNRKLVLGLTWQIMRYASIALLESVDTSSFLRWKSSPDEPISDTDVLNWANDKIRLSTLQKQSSGRTSSVKFVERPLVITEVPVSDDDRHAAEGESDDSSRVITKRSSLRSSLKRSSVELVKEVTSFKDQSLQNGCFLLSLINAVRPGTVNWKHAVPASFIDLNTTEGVKACEKNAKYVISLAFKLGCSVFLSWEDIVEVKAKALFVFVASLILLDAKLASSESRSPLSAGSPVRQSVSPMRQSHS